MNPRPPPAHNQSESTHAATAAGIALRVLVVEDSEDDTLQILRLLQRGRYTVVHERVETLTGLQTALARGAWDLVLCDFTGPGFNGLAALAVVRAADADVPVIIVSGTIGEETAVALMKAGASDYVMKGNLARLVPAVRREVREAESRHQRRRAEEALRTSEAEFHTLAEAVPQIVWITRPNGRPTYLNHHWMDYTGLSLEKSLGIAWIRRLHPDEQQLARAAWKQAVATASTYVVEGRLRRADGIYRWWLIRGVPRIDAAGNILKWFGTCTDIHDLKLAALEIANANSALTESQRRFTDMLDNVDLVAVMLSQDDRITYCNDFLLRATGWSREDVLGGNWSDLFLPAERSDVRESAAALHAGAHAARHDERAIVTRSGQQRMILWNNSLLRSPSGAVIGSAHIGEDVTQRRDAEARVAYLNRVYALLSGINTLIVRAANPDDLYRDACRVAVEKGGFHMALICIADPVASTLVPVASAGKDAELLAAITRVLVSKQDARDSMLVRAFRENKTVVANDSQRDPQLLLGRRYTESGVRSVAVLPLAVAGTPIGVFALYADELSFFHDEELRLLVELADDVSFAVDHIGKRQRLDYLANHDDVTGLANRPLFLDRLAQALTMSAQVDGRAAVIVTDLRNFRSANDSLGWSGGNELLKQVADRLVNAAGGATRVARITADHFAIMATHTGDAQQVGRFLEQLLHDVFVLPYWIGGTELKVATRCGVALFPADGADAETLLRNAKLALQRAKKSGELYTFYAREMTDRVAGNLALESRLRHALERGEFVLYYQPKVDVGKRGIVGVEALIRWLSPERGLVPPLEFIPLMEESGLILEVGAWALAQAAGDHRKWTELGLRAPRVAVNVSQAQVRQRDFVDVVNSAIAGGVTPTGIDLEITESLLMDDINGTIDKLKALRTLGIRIAIDDFGTGYSSLAVVSRLPLETLKIDRSFIITMLEHPDRMSLVQTIISLAHSLRLNVVAEGVDSEDQAKILRLLRCDEMQGFLFGKAVPFNEMTLLLGNDQGKPVAAAPIAC